MRETRKSIVENQIQSMENKPINNYDEQPTKFDYARLTFILSFIGFLGSIGFYLGVIRQIYSPVLDKQKIEVLKVENQKLENTINILVEQIKEND